MLGLPADVADKCAADGVFQSTGSDGPAGQPVRDAFHRVRSAPRTDLTGSGGIQPNDFSDIEGMTLQQFIAADCTVLTADRMAEIWSGIVDDAAFYWRLAPLLPSPFPRNKFQQPNMSCTDTSLADLSGSLIKQWEGAQSC